MKKLILAIVLFMAGCSSQAPQLVYKGGDLVRLKSGSPNMTVRYDYYSDRWYVYVVWTDVLGNKQEAAYEPAVLIKVEE